MSLGSSMQHEAAIKVAMPDKANAIDYKLSLSLGQLSAFVLTLPYII
jgi:hypothetical protein